MFSRRSGWFDPCPLGSKHDALDPEFEWGPSRYAGRRCVFVNPPYSNPKPWIERSIMENRDRGALVVLLLKHDSSTEWYRLLHEAGAHFLLVHGRLKHQTGTGANFPSMIAVIS